MEELIKIELMYLASWARSLALYYQSFFIFYEYPKNLPRKAKREIKKDYKKFKKFLKSISELTFDLSKSNDFISISQDLQKFGLNKGKEFAEQASGVFGLSFSLMSFSSKFVKTLSNLDFDFKAFDLNYVISIQQIILFIAYLDAYIKDVTRLVCKIRYRNIQQTSDELEKSIDEFVRKFPMAFKLRIKKIKEELKINFKFKDEQLSKISYYEQVRRAYVHNFGRVDNKFITKTGLTHLTIGEIISIDFYEVIELANIVSNVMANTIQYVVESCFEIKTEDLEKSLKNYSQHFKI